MAADTQTLEIYDEVTINSQKPIEGSVSMSVSTESQTKLKYEGGKIAGYKAGGDPEVTLSWKTPGACTSATSVANQSITITAGTSSVTITGVLTTSPGWDSSWGFTTEYSIVGKVGSASAGS